MGTGERAHQISDLSITLIENFYKASERRGIDKGEPVAFKQDVSGGTLVFLHDGLEECVRILRIDLPGQGKGERIAADDRNFLHNSLLPHDPAAGTPLGVFFIVSNFRKKVNPRRVH